MFLSDYDKRKSFLLGMGRVLDLGSTASIMPSYVARSPEEIDVLALGEDWRAVRVDINRAVARYREEQNLGEQEE